MVLRRALRCGSGHQRLHRILERCGCTPKPAKPEPNRRAGEDKTLPRPCGQFWMIRRSTSAQFVPANAGAKAKNPVGSTLFSTPMVALLRHPGHKILRTCCRESARKRLRALDPRFRGGD